MWRMWCWDVSVSASPRQLRYLLDDIISGNTHLITTHHRGEKSGLIHIIHNYIHQDEVCLIQNWFKNVFVENVDDSMKSSECFMILKRCLRRTCTKKYIYYEIMIWIRSKDVWYLSIKFSPQNNLLLNE